MALSGETGAASEGRSYGLSCGPESGSSPDERDAQVQVVKASLLCRLGPYEPLVTRVQGLLLWERPFPSLLLYTAANAVFWFLALTSLRVLFLLSAGLAVAVCVDTWRKKIWPEIRVRRVDEYENESWGLVQPGILSVPELCHHMAELWVSVSSFTACLLDFKRHDPGKFCLLACSFFSFLAMLGYYVPGLVLSYAAVLMVLLSPLAAYHRMWQRLCVRLEPALQRLDFSVRGYMMSKPMENQFLRRAIRPVATADASDSEEELAAFCPTLDDAVAARELAITDSEHSDAEVSYTENGTFNLSRGQTPLTEGSEDLDRHSDAEESFAQDLPDFPSINPDATLLDDDDDTSIGLPSLAPSSLSGRRSVPLDMDVDAPLDSDQEELDAELSLSGLPPAANFTGDISGMIASSMIQAALAGALQPRPPIAPQRETGFRSGPRRACRKQSSSELDTDLENEDFEMLDQSELNQMDPLGTSARGAGQPQNQGSSFLSNFLGKPQ
ncbi:reticulophagy regulator 3 [Brienomyrus brachyistius]|uniref:reticulophagy regulator 3 n=1 Tax=Brienomyrus brachyistius TaxID=42636 RepID=UPI0020B2E00C|nr:reticulophagy regulator 3 [Brienomyrus brachyistius]